MTSAVVTMPVKWGTLGKCDMRSQNKWTIYMYNKFLKIFVKILVI